MILPFYRCCQAAKTPGPVSSWANAVTAPRIMLPPMPLTTHVPYATDARALCYLPLPFMLPPSPLYVTSLSPSCYLPLPGMLPPSPLYFTSLSPLSNIAPKSGFEMYVAPRTLGAVRNTCLESSIKMLKSHSCLGFKARTCGRMGTIARHFPGGFSATASR